MESCVPILFFHQEMVTLYFHDCYEATTANIIGAMYMVSESKVPEVNVNLIRENYKGEIEKKLRDKEDTDDNYDQKIISVLDQLRVWF